MENFPIIKRLLVLLPAILALPLLSSAQTPICTISGGGSLLLDGPASTLTESGTSESATYTCTGVALSSTSGSMVSPEPGSASLSDIVSWTSGTGPTSTAVITFTSDATCLTADPASCETPSVVQPPETPMLLTGTFYAGGNQIPVGFKALSDPDPSISGGASDLFLAQTPEPGTMLLFGTGLLAAAGIIRRRMVHA
jgi:hypothetical protein